MFQAGLTILLINLSNQTTYNVEVQSNSNTALPFNNKRGTKKKWSFYHGLKKSVSWIGNKASDEELTREEYNLSPKNGNLQSRIMLLNGEPLQLTERGDIPNLVGVLSDIKSPLSIAPSSIKFVVYPNFSSKGCE